MAACLAAPGFRVMAIKGIHLAFEFPAAPWERPLMDADFIVDGGSYRHAVRVLTRSGHWRVVSDDWSAKTLTRWPHDGSFLDFHRLVAPPLFGGPGTPALWARARPAAHLEGVYCPEAVDAACIAIAHYVKDALGNRGHGRLAADLELLMKHAELRPADLAHRLAEHRLRRMGLLAFAALAEDSVQWREWQYANDPTDAERLVTRMLLFALRRSAGAHPDLELLLARAAADNWARATGSVSFGAMRLVRDALQRLVRR